MTTRIMTDNPRGTPPIRGRAARVLTVLAAALLAASCDGGAAGGDMAAGGDDLAMNVADMAAPAGADLANPDPGDMAAPPPADMAGSPPADMAGSPPADMAMAPPPRDLTGAPEDLAGQAPADMAFDAAGSDLSRTFDMAGPPDFAFVPGDMAVNCQNSRLLEPGPCTDCFKQQCNQQAVACLGANWATMDTQGSICFGLSNCICTCNAGNQSPDCFSFCLQKAGQNCSTCMMQLVGCGMQKCANVCKF